MDGSAILFYAIICGGLALFSPALHTPVLRATIGAVVGIIAAFLYPIARSAFGL